MTSVGFSLYGGEAKDGGLQSNDASLEELRGTNILDRGVVIETMCDPSLRTDPPSSLAEGKDEDYIRAPRNSLVVRILTGENSLAKSADIVCFPMFSSHLAMPVKPGEQVWVLRERLMASPREGRAFWLSRVADELALEDANFTPFTRNAVLISTGSDPVGDERIVGYPNEKQIGVFLIDGGSEAIAGLITGSKESDQVVREPVPRLTKRPGDLVIQGSNNTLISLGTDRGFGLADRPAAAETSSASTKPESLAGSIDIVTGRGRYFDTNPNEISKPRGKGEKAGPEKSTAPFIVKNSLDEFEVDKNPGATQERNAEEDLGDRGAPADPGDAATNPKEGDPDFLVDASRIYVSEKTAIDDKLGLSTILAAPMAGSAPPAITSSPAIALKTDHVRIVSRKIDSAFTSTKDAVPDNATDAGSTNGTIRIVKEGNAKEDLAVIYIEADGSIQISGSKIFIGRASADDGGKGKLAGPGPDSSQPYVRYADLEKLWQDTMDALDAFCTTVSTHVTPGYGQPSPQLNQAAADLQSAVAGLKPQIEEVKSERIFGE